MIVLATLAGLTQNLTTAGGITGGTAGGAGAICAVSCEPPAPFCRGGTCRTQCQSDEECQKFPSPKPFCTSGNCYENCRAGAFCSVISSAHQKCDTTSRNASAMMIVPTEQHQNAPTECAAAVKQLMTASI